MIKRFHYSSRFQFKLKAFSSGARREIITELNSFAETPDLPHFRLHKLKNKLGNLYSISVGPDTRILMCFLNDDRSEAYVYDIGGHEIYK